MPDVESSERRVMLGNEAMARGLLEAGCQVLCSYPGTPSSEILPAFVQLKREHDIDAYAEWSVNEKVAFDNAYAAALTGKRAACCMKQVGLNVACDSLMSAAYLGCAGGFVIISCDDPGPHSSQTEQDTRLMSLFAKVPAFDPSTPEEAIRMIARAFELSEAKQLPVIVRPAIRVCHAKQDIVQTPLASRPRRADFQKDPRRWAATPKFRYVLHEELNRKLAQVVDEPQWADGFNVQPIPDGEHCPAGIIAGGVPFVVVRDILDDAGVGLVPMMKVGMPNPYPRALLREFCERCDKVLVVEETGAFLELILESRPGVCGRNTGHVPQEGELVPELLYRILSRFLDESLGQPLAQSIDPSLLKLLEEVKPAPRRPTLCPGCPHRPAFFAIRRRFPKAIFTSDIGCYTLGLNLGAVDTVLDMGAGVTMASGFYQAYHQDGKDRPIVATIGDSTFYHSGTAALMNAVYNRARMLLVILDNKTTAMTGMQPTPGLGIRADGSAGGCIPLERVVRGCGVETVLTHDPYDVSGFSAALAEAEEAVEREGVAVLISEHPCIIAYRDQLEPKRMNITDACDGCLLCVKRFECPAFEPIPGEKKVRIREALCAGCGVCVQICPRGAIEAA